MEEEYGRDCMSINYKTPEENASEILFANAFADLFFVFSAGRRLSAHKALLSELSPLIRSLCLEQALSPEIYISVDDMEYESLSLLLSLIYSGYSSVGVNGSTFLDIQELACSLGIMLSNVSYLNDDSFDPPEDYFIEDAFNNDDPLLEKHSSMTSHGRVSKVIRSPSRTTRNTKKDEGNHVCPKCFKEFERRSRLREHFAVHYSFEIENEAVNCGIYLREHRYFCLLCKKKLRDNRIFSYHMGYVHKLLLPHIADDPDLVSKLFNSKVPISCS